MHSKRKWWIVTPLILLIVYLMGPHPQKPHLDPFLPVIPEQLDSFVIHNELQHKIRLDNEARIVWVNDTAREKTAYAILYLHGFSASQAEGEPVHKNIAAGFNCNLYLSRLAEHGIDTTEQLINFTADKLWESAKEAYAIASKLGDKVIIMGTSTGGTLALMLAANYPEIHSLILLSPNVSIFDKNAWLLNKPWGLEMARMVIGSDYVYADDERPIYKQYWNFDYRLEAVTELQEMLEISMTKELFQKIEQPTLMLYYYKDEVHQDSVVSVEAMHKMFTALKTPQHLKKSIAMPNAGNHVLGSYIKSGDVEGVQNEIENFMINTLKIPERKR